MAGGLRLKMFIDQAKAIYYFFLLGDTERQARTVNGLFEYCLSDKEKSDVQEEVRVAQGKQTKGGCGENAR